MLCWICLRNLVALGQRSQNTFLLWPYAPKIIPVDTEVDTFAAPLTCTGFLKVDFSDFQEQFLSSRSVQDRLQFMGHMQPATHICKVLLKHIYGCLPAAEQSSVIATEVM
jgi:hypothetical protein